eukprot:4163619-Karenia_brevis.AAC.1
MAAADIAVMELDRSQFQGAYLSADEGRTVAAADTVSLNADQRQNKCGLCSPIMFAPKRQLNCQTCPAMLAHGRREACGLRNCLKCQR